MFGEEKVSFVRARNSITQGAFTDQVIFRTFLVIIRMESEDPKDENISDIIVLIGLQDSNVSPKIV